MIALLEKSLNFADKYLLEELDISSYEKVKDLIQAKMLRAESTKYEPTFVLNQKCCGENSTRYDTRTEKCCQDKTVRGICSSKFL